MSLTCTWKKDSDCAACSLNERLHCKWNARWLLLFSVPAYLLVGLSVFALFITRHFLDTTLYAWIYIAFLLAFFPILEIKILCSHCPYYSEESRVLHCLANHGAPKIWKYNPAPMRSWEKILLVICFIIFGFYPLVVESVTVIRFFDLSNPAFIRLLIFSALNLITGVTFWVLLASKFCPNCVNFSCPLNRVPKKSVDEYLKQNPEMRKAWENSGYKVE